MRNNNPTAKYQSKGRTISKSTSHPGYYVIDSGETFHIIACSDEFIKVLYPEDIKVTPKLRKSA